MNQHTLNSPLFRCTSFALLFLVLCASVPAQPQAEKPLESQELVRLVYQLPQHPERKAAVIEEIRRRGIAFELTSGMRSLVASKSGNDAALRRTLEEADRRRASPATIVRPNEAEARVVLENSRQATRQAAGAMPDFVVKQLITRARALGETKNYRVLDHLTVGVSYRESEGGERYRLLAVDGVPTATPDARERGSYEQESGASSTGEFVSMLKELFSDEAKAKFEAVDTDTIRERRALIYEYEVKLENSQQTLSFRAARGADPLVARVGSRGRVWIDRETFRVLRLENVATEIPAGFPISGAVNTIDYDWVTIAERKYLLPVRAEVELTSAAQGQVFQARNEIRFRNYQKFGAEVKIVEEGDFEEEPPKKKP
ncbi:MAG TPA: hypothetical protein VF538_04400 [Pyrinomonadaceae bacterium]|jgi:hypothetical protein